MRNPARILAGACASVLASAAIVLGGAPAAQAQSPNCFAQTYGGTGGYSQCLNLTTLHRVELTCRAWWNPWTTYTRTGNTALGFQRSYASCDVPFTLVSARVVIVH